MTGRGKGKSINFAKVYRFLFLFVLSRDNRKIAYTLGKLRGKLSDFMENILIGGWFEDFDLELFVVLFGS